MDTFSGQGPSFQCPTRGECIENIFKTFPATLMILHDVCISCLPVLVIQEGVLETYLLCKYLVIDPTTRARTIVTPSACSSDWRACPLSFSSVSLKEAEKKKRESFRVSQAIKSMLAPSGLGALGSFRLIRTPLLPLAKRFPFPFWARRCGRLFAQHYVMSSISRAHQEPFASGKIVKSDFGSSYKIEKALVDRRNPLLCVYLARCACVSPRGSQNCC